MSRAEAQGRKERRKNKDIIKGAARGKGKSWKIDFSRKGAKAQRSTQTKDIIKGAARRKGKSWKIDFSRKGAKAQRKTKQRALLEALRAGRAKVEK